MSKLQPGNLLLLAFVDGDLGSQRVCRLCKKPILEDQSATWSDSEMSYVHRLCEDARRLASIRARTELKGSIDE